MLEKNLTYYSYGEAEHDEDTPACLVTVVTVASCTVFINRCAVASACYCRGSAAGFFYCSCPVCCPRCWRPVSCPRWCWRPVVCPMAVLGTCIRKTHHHYRYGR